MRVRVKKETPYLRIGFEFDTDVFGAESMMTEYFKMLIINGWLEEIPNKKELWEKMYEAASGSPLQSTKTCDKIAHDHYQELFDEACKEIWGSWSGSPATMKELRQKLFGGG